MKILVINAVKPYCGSGTGLAEYAYQLSEHLKLLMPHNSSIDFLYALEDSKRNNIKGLLYSNTAFKKMVAKVPKDKYDVIHITDHEIGFAAKILKKSENKANIITTVHDLSRFEKGLHRGISQKVYNKLVQGSIKDAIKYSDFILCNSSQTLETIIQRFGPIKNIKVVNHGTNDKIINSKLPKRKPSKEFVIGYIGALMKHKNVIFILNAAKILNNKAYKFILYGTGMDMDMLQRFKETNGLDNLELLGYLNEENKVKAYDSFNVFVFPSLYEGLGYPILEAQSRGLPVIIYKYGKIPKEVRKYCFEAESPEHMAQIIEDLEENGYNEKLQKEATVYARSFTWEKTAKETLEAYKRVLK
ncbi:MAG: glycosyltransferase [Candidatus Micrarchaeales archaeon]|jgi:glycosyltransferase involved in cell wall biosynthesis|nr:glycosyltransferase [Candidatus Micrarchaeales archaeon]